MQKSLFQPLEECIFKLRLFESTFFASNHVIHFRRNTLELSLRGTSRQKVIVQVLGLEMRYLISPIFQNLISSSIKFFSHASNVLLLMNHSSSTVRVCTMSRVAPLMVLTTEFWLLAMELRKAMTTGLSRTLGELDGVIRATSR